MPPPPPPPPPSGPPPSRSGIGAKSSNNAIPTDHNALLGEIHKGMRLKKTVTNDRSAPVLGKLSATFCLFLLGNTTNLGFYFVETQFFHLNQAFIQTLYDHEIFFFEANLHTILGLFFSH